MIINDIKYKVYINGVRLRQPRLSNPSQPSDPVIPVISSTFDSQISLSNILYSDNKDAIQISNNVVTTLTNVIGEDVPSSGNSNDFEAQLVMRNVVLSGEKENEEEIVSETNTILTNIIGE